MRIIRVFFSEAKMRKKSCSFYNKRDTGLFHMRKVVVEFIVF